MSDKIRGIIEGLRTMLATDKKKLSKVDMDEVLVGPNADRFIENTNLSMSVYRDKITGIIYVDISDRNKPNSGTMITAEAAFHLAETVNKVFSQKVNAIVSNSLN